MTTKAVPRRAPVADRPPLDRAIRKAMLRLMPFLILMYMIAFLDRSNVGIAKQALQAEAGIPDTMFAFGAGIFFVGYALFEVPSNLVMHRFGTRVWMSRIMISWGLISAATLFVTGPTSFVVVRLLLGIAEAGFFPGVILYFTYWFPARDRARVLGLFYFGYPLALTLGNPLSGALLLFDGSLGLRGWQWMFLVEGLAAVLVGLLTLLVLPEKPNTVTWLSADEKQALDRALSTEAAAKEQAGRTSLGGGFLSGRLLQFVGIYFLLQIGSYGVVFYLPEQVSTLLGMKIGPVVGLVSALPWLCAIVLAAFYPALAERLRQPRFFLLGCIVVISGGLLASAHGAPIPAVIGLCFAASGIISSQAVFWTFPTSYFGGIAAAGTIAFINAIGNLGGFVAPNLRSLAAHHWNTPIAGLYAVAIGSGASLLLVVFLPARGFGVRAPQP